MGVILSIVFADELLDDDSEDDDDDDCDCYTEKGLRTAQGMAGLTCVVTASLTWYFIRSGRYAKFHNNTNAQTSSVHPVEEKDEPAAAEKGDIEEEAPETPKE